MLSGGQNTGADEGCIIKPQFYYALVWKDGFVTLILRFASVAILAKLV